MMQRHQSAASDGGRSLAIPAGAGRIVWLDLLRALATLVVAWGHIFLVGINDPNTVHVWVPSVEGPIFGPGSPAANMHGQLGVAMWRALRIGPGGVGVALFFLVSGFVILRTLDRTKPLLFLLRRAIRLLPVCFVAVVLTAIGTNLLFRARGLPGPNGIGGTLSSAFALSGLTASFSVVPVLWTLAVEMLFYLVMAATALVLRRAPGAAAMVGVGLLCVLAVLVANTPALLAGAVSPSSLRLLVYFSELGAYMTYMLIGCVIYCGWRDRRWLSTLGWGAATVLVWLGCQAAYQRLNGGHLGMSPADGGFALALFLAVMALRPRGAWTAPFRFVADISYPLYLVHIPLGWALMAFLAWLGVGMDVAAFASLGGVMLVAWALHVAVEQPSHRFGRWINRPGVLRPVPALGEAG